jgi:hypothetical protein
MQIVDWCAPWKIANGVENFVLQALKFQKMSVCCKFLSWAGIIHCGPNECFVEDYLCWLLIAHFWIGNRLKEVFWRPSLWLFLRVISMSSLSKITPRYLTWFTNGIFCIFSVRWASSSLYLREELMAWVLSSLTLCSSAYITTPWKWGRAAFSWEHHRLYELGYIYTFVISE